MKDLSELSEASVDGSIRRTLIRSRAALAGNPPENVIKSVKPSFDFNS